MQFNISYKKKVLSQYSNEFKNQTFSFTKDTPSEEVYTFYEPTKGTLSIFKVKPGTFDLLLSLGTAIYLLAFWVLLSVSFSLFSFFFKNVNFFL